jgi:hypothetical protein
MTSKQHIITRLLKTYNTVLKKRYENGVSYSGRKQYCGFSLTHKNKDCVNKRNTQDLNRLYKILNKLEACYKLKNNTLCNLFYNQRALLLNFYKQRKLMFKNGDFTVSFENDYLIYRQDSYCAKIKLNPFD